MKHLLSSFWETSPQWLFTGYFFWRDSLISQNAKDVPNSKFSEIVFKENEYLGEILFEKNFRLEASPKKSSPHCADFSSRSLPILRQHEHVWKKQLSTRSFGQVKSCFGVPVANFLLKNPIRYQLADLFKQFLIKVSSRHVEWSFGKPSNTFLTNSDSPKWPIFSFFFQIPKSSQRHAENAVLITLPFLQKRILNSDNFFWKTTQNVLLDM